MNTHASCRFDSLWCLTPLPTIFQLYRDGHSVLLVEETGVPEDNHRASCKLNRSFNIFCMYCDTFYNRRQSILYTFIDSHVTLF